MVPILLLPVLALRRHAARLRNILRGPQSLLEKRYFYLIKLLTNVLHVSYNIILFNILVRLLYERR